VNQNPFFRGQYVGPQVVDGSTHQPQPPLVLTKTNLVAVEYVEFQTKSATAVNVLSIPLPGTQNGQLLRTGIVVPDAGLVWIDAEVKLQSLTTAAGAVFKVSWGWSVLTAGSPVALGTTATSGLSVGTNGGAAPAGWAATIVLDSASLNALVQVTGDATLVVDGACRIEVGILL
jgi:hypothetical protein